MWTVYLLIGSKRIRVTWLSQRIKKQFIFLSLFHIFILFNFKFSRTTFISTFLRYIFFQIRKFHIIIMNVFCSVNSIQHLFKLCSKPSSSVSFSFKFSQFHFPFGNLIFRIIKVNKNLFFGLGSKCRNLLPKLLLRAGILVIEDFSCWVVVKEIIFG